MGTFRKIPRVEIPKIRKLFLDGKSLSEIADQYGVSYGSIKYHVRTLPEYKAVMDAILSRWTPERIRKCVELYESGLSVKRLARAMESNHSRVLAVLKRAGVALRKPKHSYPGSENPSYRGGRTLRKGYWYILRTDHPHATNGGYVLEHRLVMEGIIGRTLRPGEVVHHKNRDRLDNRPENLELFASNAAHLAHELRGQVPKWSPEGWAAMQAMTELKKVVIPPRELRRMYVTERRGTGEIATHFNCCTSTIRKRLRKLGIVLRKQ